MEQVTPRRSPQISSETRDQRRDGRPHNVGKIGSRPVSLRQIIAFEMNHARIQQPS